MFTHPKAKLSGKQKRLTNKWRCSNLVYWCDRLSETNKRTNEYCQHIFTMRDLSFVKEAVRWCNFVTRCLNVATCVQSYLNRSVQVATKEEKS